jgi:hypothetical protein
MPVLVESSTGISPVESSRDEHQPQIRNSTQNRNRKFLTPDRKFGPKAGIRAKSENSAPKPQIDQKTKVRPKTAIFYQKSKIRPKIAIFEPNRGQIVLYSTNVKPKYFQPGALHRNSDSCMAGALPLECRKCAPPCGGVLFWVQNVLYLTDVKPKILKIGGASPQF